MGWRKRVLGVAAMLAVAVPVAAALPTRVELATVGPDFAEWIVDTDGPAVVEASVLTSEGEVHATVDAVKGRYFRARVTGLVPGRDYRARVVVDGIEALATPAAPATFRTLEPPPGELLFRFATVTDTHVGEEVAGLVGGLGYQGFSWPDPDHPYWRFTNEAAVREINASGVDFVIHKGDLTAEARPEELAEGKAIFDGLRVPWHPVRGNHDRVRGGVDAWASTLGLARSWRALDFGGHRFLLLDTVAPETGVGWMGEDQLAWVEAELSDARSALRPIWVVGHHPLCEEAGPLYVVLGDALFRMQEAMEGAAPAVVGALAGHSHRNVRLDAVMVPGVPFVETASTKEYPGMWTEVRVFQGGWMQIAHVIDCPECREWYAITTGEYGGNAQAMQFGRLEDRCFTVVFDPSLGPPAIPGDGGEGDDGPREVVPGEDVAVDAEGVAREDSALPDGDGEMPPDPGASSRGSGCAADPVAFPVGTAILAFVTLLAFTGSRFRLRCPRPCWGAGRAEGLRETGEGLVQEL